MGRPDVGRDDARVLRDGRGVWPGAIYPRAAVVAARRSTIDGHKGRAHTRSAFSSSRPVTVTSSHGRHRGCHDRDVPCRGDRSRCRDGAACPERLGLGSGRRRDVDRHDRRRYRWDAYRRGRDLRRGRRCDQRRRVEPVVVRDQHIPGVRARWIVLRRLLSPSQTPYRRRALHHPLAHPAVPVAHQPVRANRVRHRERHRGLCHRCHPQHAHAAADVRRCHGGSRHLRHLRLVRRAVGHGHHELDALRGRGDWAACGGSHGDQPARGLGIRSPRPSAVTWLSRP